MKSLWTVSTLLLITGWSFGPVERLITYSQDGLNAIELSSVFFASIFAIATLLSVSLPHLPGWEDDKTID
jgi:hypothetical protein